MRRMEETMESKLKEIKEEALKQIEASEALDKLNEIRVAYLGKKGELTALLKSMKDLKAEERPKFGQLVNDARQAIEDKLEESKSHLTSFKLRVYVKHILQPGSPVSQVTPSCLL